MCLVLHFRLQATRPLEQHLIQLLNLIDIIFLLRHERGFRIAIDSAAIRKPAELDRAVTVAAQQDPMTSPITTTERDIEVSE